MQNRFLDRLKSRKERPLVIAHRGDSFHAPENTLEAARLAREASADAWELDVQLTRDGVAVVIHDESLVRTTDVAARYPDDPRGTLGFLVCEFDHREIHSLDAGSWFLCGSHAPRSASGFGTLQSIPEKQRACYRSGLIRVPTLVEALQLTARLDWLVNVEIKAFPENPPGLLEAVLRAIEFTGTGERVLISSFDHDLIARLPAMTTPFVNEEQPIARGILISTPLARPHDYLTKIVGADTIHLSAECLGAASIGYRRSRFKSALRAAEVAALRDAGIPVLVYTVNDTAAHGLADHLAELGVDGIFTDDPAGMVAHFARAAPDRSGSHS
jgi:glycerophosphoryl diester phosphodiesterase